MILFFQIEQKKIIDVSDIKNEKHNVEKEFNNQEDFYKYLHENTYTFDDSLIDEVVKSVFNDEDATDNLSSYKIKHWVSNRSFGELIDMYNNDEIIVPNMQRNFVWDSLKCSRLIESIILGLPIPPLFLLEISDNKYELIDGFQRLTTLANYVGGKQWNYDKNITEKVIPAKLSSKVANEISKKTFRNLDSEYQMKLRRSTIPLIEFKQLNPENYDSKYLIFERINTGSVKLNPMQIRKSLSYGNFIESLYNGANNIASLNDIYSVTNIKKDNHVEAILRTLCFYSYIYEEEFTPKSNGIKSILNEYCEYRKNEEIAENEFILVENALSILTDTFSSDEIFKRVEVSAEDEVYFTGNLNTSIFESLMGAVMRYINKGLAIDKEALCENYKEKMIEISDTHDKSGNNPFSISTGSLESIRKRFEICDQIVVDSLS